MSTNVPRTIGGALCAIGAALSLVIIFISCMDILAHGEIPAIPRFTSGTVTSYDMPNTDAYGRRLASPLYFPVISYRDRTGVEQSFLSDPGSAQRSYAT